MLTANTAGGELDQALYERYPTAGRLGSKRQVRIDVVAGLICILPLLVTAHLPLTDLPNHLARQYVLRDWASSPYLQAYYYIRWDLVPNLALELFVLAARQVMSIDMAVRVFCVATVLMLFLGTRLVNRELSGGQSRLYRFAPLLCYGGPLQFGFLNYCFGVGLGILLFGFYLRLRMRAKAGVAVFLVASGFALMLCHLAAFGLFAVAVGGCEIAYVFSAVRWNIRRLAIEVPARLVVPVACLLPVMLAFLMLGPSSDQNAAVNAARFAFRLSTLHEKARSIYAIMLFASPWLEAGLLALGLAGLVAALTSGTIRFHRVGYTVLAAMLIVWILLPSVGFGSAFVDYRIPWGISFFLLAGLVPAPRYKRLSYAFAGYFGILTAARITLIAVSWLKWEPTLTALDKALDHVPPGVRLTVVEGQLPGGKLFRQPDLANVASYAVARQQAFDPDMFANLSGQILHFQPHFEELWAQDDFARKIPSMLTYLSPEYDYVLVLLPKFAHISPLLALTCQANGPNFELLKVDHSGTILAADADQSGHCSISTNS